MKFLPLITCLFLLIGCAIKQPPVINERSLSELSGKIVFETDGHKIALIDLAVPNSVYVDTGELSSPKLSPDGKEVLYVQRIDLDTASQRTHDATIKIYEIETEKVRILKQLQQAWIYGLSWSNNGTKIVYVLNDTIQVMDKEGNLVADFVANNEPYKHISRIGRFQLKDPIFSKDDQSILLVGRRSTDQGWDQVGIYDFNIATKDFKRVIDAPNLESFCFSQDYSKVALLQNTTISLLNLSTNKSAKLADKAYDYCVWSPDSKQIVYGSPRPFSTLLRDVSSYTLDAHMVNVSTGERAILLNSKLLTDQFYLFKEDSAQTLDWKL